MDFQRLYQILPKLPIKWTVSDVTQWLKFIDLQLLIPSFSNSLLIEQASIDGSCLTQLTDEDLKLQLKISSSITRKKILNCKLSLLGLKNGIKQYGIYLKQFQVSQQNSIVINKYRNQTMLKSKLQKPNNENLQQKKQQQLSQPYLQFKTSKIQQRASPSQIEQSRQLIVSHLDNTHSSFYCISQKGGKIGRHSSNQILILQQSISRFHAQIYLQNNQFYLEDIGSTTGTFIKICDRRELQLVYELNQGNIIEMGANQFQIFKLEVSSPYEGIIILGIIQGPNIQNFQRQQFQLNGKNDKICIGRKNANQIGFSDDQHLSSIHAKIFMLEQKFYIQDLSSTNGTWLRLSKQGQRSLGFLLSQGSIFKIGINTTFSCKTNKQIIYINKNQLACVICCENQKDTLYIPCKHHISCFKCSKNLKTCPICKRVIDQRIKMYRS